VTRIDCGLSLGTVLISPLNYVAKTNRKLEKTAYCIAS